ncbi:hypothetical protein AAMO2058_001515400 [Amorphochlora amoebiformis]
MIVSSVDKPALHWSYSRERGGVTVKWDRIDVSIPVRQYPSEAVNDGQQQSITGVVNSTVTYVLRFGLKLKGTRSMNQIIILSAAVLVLAMGVVWVMPAVFYYYQLAHFFSDGLALYNRVISRASVREPIDMFQASVYTSTLQSKRRMKQYALDDKELSKSNFLGFLMLSSTVMENGTIALGASKDVHDKIRVDFDLLAGNKPPFAFDEKSIESDVQEFLARFEGKEMTIRKDISPFILRVLWNHWIGDEMTDSEAAEFVDYQKKRLLLSIAPGWVSYLMRSWVRFVKEAQAKWLLKIETLLGESYGKLGKHKTPSEMALLAWAVLDALTFAGGLGVPTLTHHCIAVIANGEASAVLDSNGRLDRKKIDHFIMETSRLYPAVTEVPFLRSGKREVISIGMQSREKAVWGDDADTWKLRPLPLYHENLNAFAEFAHPTRSCPGKGLSLAIIRGFLKQLNEYSWSNVDTSKPLKANGFRFPEFTIRLSSPSSSS